ncbi:MAG TPA: hypothetical protein VK943_13320, partial [Arenibaculum sp.]|nr:hypothetical protein [Arenibaculum sp.]
CDPEKAIAVDLLTARPDSVPAGLKLRKKVTKDGPMDGFAFYFKIIFDEDLSIETGPFAVRAHWPCQLLRSERIDLEKGDLLDIEWEIGDHTDVRTWRVDHRVVRREKPPAPSPTAPSPAGVHPETG